MQPTSSYSPVEIDNFIKNIQKSSSILVVEDDGKINDYMTQNGFKVVGITREDEKLKLNQIQFMTLEFRKVNAMEVDQKFEPDQFGGVWIGSFLADLNGDEQARVFAGVRKVLGKNGVLHLACKVPVPKDAEFTVA